MLEEEEETLFGRIPLEHMLFLLEAFLNFIEMVSPSNICQCMEISGGSIFALFAQTPLSFARSHKTHPGEKAIYFEDFQQEKLETTIVLNVFLILI